jgi:hypothetical protein
VERGAIGDRESGTREVSDLQHCKSRFPDGEIPDKSKGKHEVNTHRGSGICEARICECRTHDHARSDFPIGQREIVRRTSYGCRKVLIGDLKRILALRAEGKEGPGEVDVL